MPLQAGPGHDPRNRQVGTAESHPGNPSLPESRQDSKEKNRKKADSKNRERFAAVAEAVRLAFNSSLSAGIGGFSPLQSLLPSQPAQLQRFLAGRAGRTHADQPETP
jgi:hypothetical protein